MRGVCTARAARLARSRLARSARAETRATRAPSVKASAKRVALGLIDRVPRIAVVQAAGAAPFCARVRDGRRISSRSTRRRPRQPSRSVHPHPGEKALREVRASKGTVTDGHGRGDRRRARDRRPRRRRLRTGFSGVACRCAKARAGRNDPARRRRRHGPHGTRPQRHRVRVDLPSERARFANRIGAARDDADLRRASSARYGSSLIP